MCGRFGLRFPDHPDLFELGPYPPPGTSPRYNVAPTQPVLALLERDGERQDEVLRWGFIPSWAKDPADITHTINARAGTVAETPMYRAAFRARRCLIAADVFYEWQAVAEFKRKQPHAIRRRDDRPFLLAGLWETWGRGEARITNCAIVTTTPNATMAPIHNRMPVILDPADYSDWLNPATPIDTVRDLLRPASDDLLAAYLISAWVNSPAHDDARVLAPIH